ncbi:amidohydrolase [Sciscionella sediminilitoris]|uniref:amidohydrolase n=1 Tax=Sciscionella sediminilitoris TaxID=1445613 RepID=UPI0004DFBF51|nr:amidohydrolase [Sciscionella sp. SE31]
MRFAITGGYVVPVDGEPIEGATVLVEDGVITALGTDVAVPEDTEIIDAQGSWVLPGFVEAHGHIGVWEEGDGWAGDDVNEMTDPNGAALRALDAVNPDDEGFRDALAGGVTTAVIKPGSGNPIGGQTAALKCWGATVDEMLVRQPVSIKSALGENPKRIYGEQKKLPSTRLGVAAVIRKALLAARDYGERKAAAARDGEPFQHDLGNEALLSVLNREIPWCQHTHRADDIATAIRLAEEFGYRLVVNHGTEGHRIVDLLADKDIPVIIGPLIVNRSKVEVRRRGLRNPGLLAKAGVRIAITTDHPVVPIDFLVHQATFAVKEGLDRETALRAITLEPARILGLDDRVGALKPGLDADIVLWSGDPLDVMSRAHTVFVRGKRVYSFDEHTGKGATVSPFHAD